MITKTSTSEQQKKESKEAPSPFLTELHHCSEQEKLPTATCMTSEMLLVNLLDLREVGRRSEISILTRHDMSEPMQYGIKKSLYRGLFSQE